MNAKSIILITAAAALVAAAPSPVDAGSSFGIHVSNHGVSVGFGTNGWGIWGSSWHTGGVSLGYSAVLDGYGQWVWVDGLGRVWRPWVTASWQPFSHGRWVWTSFGWTWVAYEPWGWMPHHYGNWAYTTFGWVWRPGSTYHPGNVVWYSSGSYVGWAPCAPHGWSHAHRAYHHGWNNGYDWGHHDGYRQGYRDGWRDARYATWVPRSQVMTDNVSRHVVGHASVTGGAARSRVTALAAPPSKREVERMVGRQVAVTRVAERTVKVEGRDLRVVRPEGQSDTVRRYGADTVKRALSPASSDRIRSGASSSRARISTPPTSSRSPVASRTAGRVSASHSRFKGEPDLRTPSDRSQNKAAVASARHRSITTSRNTSAAQHSRSVSSRSASRSRPPAISPPSRPTRLPTTTSSKRTGSASVSSRGGSRDTPPMRRGTRITSSNAKKQQSSATTRNNRSGSSGRRSPATKPTHKRRAAKSRS